MFTSAGYITCTKINFKKNKTKKTKIPSLLPRLNVTFLSMADLYIVIVIDIYVLDAYKYPTKSQRIIP